MCDFKGIFKTQSAIRKQLFATHSNFKKSPKDRLTWHYVKTKLELLEQLWEKFQNNHLSILQENEEELEDNYLEMYLETEDEYANMRDNMLKKLSDLKPQNTTTENTCSQIKLAPIEIPKFDGQYSEWTSFHDQFMSLVHLNTSLSNVSKLHMLKQNLIGEAANLLKNIAITENNYEHAWEKLKRRYSNKRVIINSYLQKLTSIRPIANENSNTIKYLLDTATDCLSGLQSIGIETKSWDPIIIYLLTNKLDSESVKRWEETINKDLNDELPTYKQFTEFLEMRFRSLEGIQSSKSSTRVVVKPTTERKSFFVTPKEGCVVCGDAHYIFRCKQFVQMSLPDKKRFIQQRNLCYNCLIPNHTVKSCKAVGCRICGKRHHSLIHTDYNTSTPLKRNERLDKDREHRESRTNNQDSITQQEENSTLTHHVTEATSICTTNVLLATAIVKVESNNGHTLSLRALIDQGSEGSFITENAVQRLGLKKNNLEGSISGLGNRIVAHTRCSVTFKLKSHFDKSLQLPVNAYVLTSLTRLLPSRQVNNTWLHLQGLTLADPEYNKPAKIDLLLGAEVYGQIMLEGIISGSAGTPLAQKTKLGWILSGQVYTTTDLNNTPLVNMHITTQAEDIEQLQRFWELESDGIQNHVSRMTDEEIICEKIFAETHTRDNEGRYIVKIPFKNKNLDYGDTRLIAAKRLEQLERRLNRDSELKEEYTNVLMEYLHLHHMVEINSEDKDTHKKYYMPHHPVLRPDKSTSKLRIVFDCSCKGPYGKSLNDNMIVGPKLQPDLRHIVMRWRKHEIVFTADCIKMYRQIRVTDESSNYQRILWRVNGQLKEFRLTRVTFGTASAPYLATKTLQQLAMDEEHKYPVASLITRSDYYMDDLLSGADNVEDSIEIYKQMTKLMQAGGFQLQKWTSNNTELINKIKQETISHDDTYVIKSDGTIKTLGIKWNRITDSFHYDIVQPCISKTVTKRIILSNISRLFDPMGWLAPVIIVAKIMIQKLWLAKVTWDEEVPQELESEWLMFCQDLQETKNIVIPRWLQINNTDQNLGLHGYCDASQMAYAAVIYIRVTKADGTIHTQLVTAKTRVAPVKTVSIPRLELCGAMLLTKLLKEVSQILKIPQRNIHAYTDSAIVLAWLQSHPYKWKTFVANRTSEILNTLPDIIWSHVESGKNPADIASRGTTPAQLRQSNLWWAGPEELLKKEITLTLLKNNQTNIEKKKEKIKTFTNMLIDREFNLLNKYSNLTKLLRVTAYILRVFKRNKNEETYLSGEEIVKAKETCIRLCQREAFTDEIERLRQGKNVKRDSKILSLNPFLDKHDIIRVGGRLQNSNLPEHTKHQIILPERHPFTKLVLTDLHIRTLHGGPMLMLSNLQKTYWVIHAKKETKQIVHKCVVCARHRASTRTQLMGSLPKQRVTFSKPFSKSGVDFAGPIDLRLSKGRGHKTQRGYLAIFVCLATRAIHIEIVTSLYAADFIAAFKRFVARRGHCSEMWSDNATNLTAGNKELKAMFKDVTNKIDNEVKNLLANDGTTWHHIPASAPHFGGLWEAGVKSVKFHLKRVLKNTTLTYEEMSTVTAQIEACLNSRPISPMSDDPSDLQPLTPGHFLIGETPIIVPEEDYLSSKINRLSRWQFVQKVTQEFWKRWSNEYLSRLQQRPKWMTKQQNIKINDLVLLKDDNLPPAKWNLGRIVSVHPGLDNLVRVVSIKCKNTIVKRPITKVCCLPIEG